MLDLKFGTDPEYFSSVKFKGKDFAISPALLEKDSGLKYILEDVEEKHPIYILEKDFSWMMDGVAWELTVRKPLKSASEMFKILTESTYVLSQFLSQFKWNGMNLNFYRKPAIRLNPEWYIPYININKVYQGFIFGCDPDDDAIVQNYICKTRNVLNHNWRYGGGHIHVSGIPEFHSFPKESILFLATTVGNYCIANSPYPELEKKRVLTYGRPGRYREQFYPNGDIGVEYRSPSNSWTSFSEEQMEELFYFINRGCEFLTKSRQDIIEKYLNPTIVAITQANIELAKSILNDIVKE